MRIYFCSGKKSRRKEERMLILLILVGLGMWGYAAFTPGDQSVFAAVGGVMVALAIVISIVRFQVWLLTFKSKEELEIEERERQTKRVIDVCQKAGIGRVVWRRKLLGFDET
jgi:hypothetical protein